MNLPHDATTGNCGCGQYGFGSCWIEYPCSCTWDHGTWFACPEHRTCRGCGHASTGYDQACDACREVLEHDGDSWTHVSAADDALRAKLLAPHE